jgi:hypothetical protein
MAATLQEILLTPDNQPKVVADCQTLIDQEVADKSGISGVAIKLAYKTVTTFASGIIHDALEQLLPDFLGKLEPFYADFLTDGGAELGDYLAKRGAEVSEALLEVTDERAAISERAPIRKAYNTVRPSGVKNIESALPRLGALVQKYTG